MRQQITGQIGNGGTKEVPLKYLSNCWRTLEMSLINCGCRVLLKWSKTWIVVAGIVENQNPSFQLLL